MDEAGSVVETSFPANCEDAEYLQAQMTDIYGEDLIGISEEDVWEPWEDIEDVHMTEEQHPETGEQTIYLAEVEEAEGENTAERYWGENGCFYSYSTELQEWDDEEQDWQDMCDSFLETYDSPDFGDPPTEQNALQVYHMNLLIYDYVWESWATSWLNSKRKTAERKKKRGFVPSSRNNPLRLKALANAPAQKGAAPNRPPGKGTRPTPKGGGKGNKGPPKGGATGGGKGGCYVCGGNHFARDCPKRGQKGALPPRPTCTRKTENRFKPRPAVHHVADADANALKYRTWE